MEKSREGKTPAKDWRVPLSMGLSIGIGIAAARGVEQNLEPSLGSWGAFGMALLTVTVVSSIVALVVHLLIKPGGKS